MNFRAFSLLASAGLVLGACAASPRPASPQAASEAAEEARRAERLRLMQEYWLDQTASLPEDPGPAGKTARLLDYPAGDYDGIRFAARRQDGPSLEEPPR